MKNYKIRLFKNDMDFNVIISDEKIINITGLMGSGKTTLAKSIVNEKSLYIKLDWLFGYGYDKQNMPTKVKNIIQLLQKNYPEISEKNFFRWKNNKKHDLLIEQKYEKYVPIFYDFVVNQVKNNETLIIDGVQLYDYLDIKKLKGRLIIKGSSLFTCYKRAFKRDVGMYYKKYILKQITFKTFLKKVLERIRIPIRSYKKINLYINNVETLLKGGN